METLNQIDPEIRLARLEDRTRELLEILYDHLTGAVSQTTLRAYLISQWPTMRIPDEQ